MLKKRLLMVVMSATITFTLSMTALAAGNWQHNSTGWWWQRTDGSYPTNEWKWIDGNNDGAAECYYFDSNGYLLASTTTPDGYQVNAEGAWVVNDVIQSRQVQVDIGDEVAAAVGTATVNTDGVITDGKSVAQISLNSELADLISVNGLDKIPNKTVIRQGDLGPTYTTNYRGKLLMFETDSNSNAVVTFTGVFRQIFNNVPEQGIEIEALYENTGFKDVNGGKSVIVDANPRKVIFGIGQRKVTVLLTPGTNDTWYVYPDNLVFMR